MIKKKSLLLVVAVFIFTLIFSAFPAFAAEGYDVECDAEHNLAINKHNWIAPTLSSAEFTVDETEGMTFNNFITNQQCVTYFRGGNFGEFKLSLLVNANLTIPPEGKAQWRYSEFYITFLIDRKPEDAVAEDGKPWYANKVYGAFCFGLTSGGTPISRFMYYNAFAGNCQASGQFYQPTGYTDTNIVDGKDHWVEIEIKNYNNDGVTGQKWVAYIDGVQVAEFDRPDDTYYDGDTDKEYYVEYSKLSGGIGMYANSDWPGGYSTDRMNNFVNIKKMKLVSYDNNSDGETVGQCPAPVFDITSKEYSVAASYEAGDPIEIPLSDLFDYEGTDPVEYTVTCNGEAIGEIKNGFWLWTPTKAGSYDIDFNAVVTEENKAVNYLTFRVTGESGGGDGDTQDPNGETGGCGGVIIGGSGALSLLVLAGTALVVKRRKR